MLIAALLLVPVVMSGLATALVKGLVQLVRIAGWFVPGRRMGRAILGRATPVHPRRNQPDRLTTQQPSIV